MAQLPATIVPPATAILPFMRPEKGLTQDDVFGWTHPDALVAAYESGGGTVPDPGGGTGGTVSDGYVVDCTPAGGDNAVAGGAWATALASAVTLGRKVRLKAGNHSFATDFTFTVDVVFERGAVITHYITTTGAPGTDPSDSATVSFQGDVIADRTQRIFNFREVPENVNISPVDFQKPLNAYYEWYDDGSKFSYKTFGGDWSKGIQMALDSFRVTGNGGVVSPGRPGTLYMVRWPVYLVGKYVSQLTWNLGHSRHLTDMNNANRGFGLLCNFGNSPMGTSGATKKHRIAGNLNTAQSQEEPTGTWTTGNGVVFATGFGGIDTGPYSRGTDGTVNFSAAAAGAYPNDWTNRNTSNCRVTGPGSLEYESTIAQTGSYALQFSNCSSCWADNIYIRNCTQMFGFGSDEYQHETSQWAAPYCYNCHVSNLYTDRVNAFSVYYSLGFFGFCANCTARRVYCINTAPNGSDHNGNGVGFNYAKNCECSDFSCLGNFSNSNTQNNTGVELEFVAENCRVWNGYVKGYKRGVAHYSFSQGGGLQGAGNRNVVGNVVCDSCTNMIFLSGHYVYFINIQGVNCTNDLDNAGSVDGFQAVFVNTPIIRITGNPWGSYENAMNQRNVSWNRRSVAATVAAGAANVCTITARVQWGGEAGSLGQAGNSGILGVAMSEPVLANVWVSASNTTGAGVLSTDPSTGFAASQGVIVNAMSVYPKRFVTVQTTSAGNFTVSYTDTAKTAGYVWAEVAGETTLLGALVYG